MVLNALHPVIVSPRAMTLATCCNWVDVSKIECCEGAQEKSGPESGCGGVGAFSRGSERGGTRRLS